MTGGLINEALYVFIAFRVFEGHWAECGIVCILSINNIIWFNPINQLIELIIDQLIDYQNNR